MEDIYQWMAKQKFPLDRAGVEKVSLAKLAEMKDAGIKYVSVLAASVDEACAACSLVMSTGKGYGEVFEIDSVGPLPLPGCDRQFCKCVYIAIREPEND